MKDMSALLEISAREHGHLCPRQILGVRIGLRGICSLQLEPNQGCKRLLVITETDGCFADGLTAATNCTVGHRTLRVEDFGKATATFVDTHTGNAIRVAPVVDIRQKACLYVPDEPRHYFAQMTAYQIMPDDEMMVAQEVTLNMPIEQIISQPGPRISGMLFNDPEIFRALTQLLDKWKMPDQGNVLSPPTAGQNFGCIDLHRERFIHNQHGVDRDNTDGGFQWLC
jgi:formylmethanofuran dehydrogenase subunit E